ncbi:MAG: hypothetical protein E6732_02335 [Enterococcus faecalis]|uniref:hypothetical protein n=1 Tax=Enterococcus casseliflavus TaxID=37734 RepID=UPI001E58569D|nr:hypothetical protein [Enterococcus casseliflavus]MCD5159986.1 hypothetical protein [Enterococcus casseliflavus]MDU1987919.1 hypothetical protein [Enterococcus faecalis]MDU5812503.1 hypothetical protein [Enterococcus casseliflavus]
MATKSFKKELAFSTKTAESFLYALDNSKQVDIETKHQVKISDDKSSIESIFRNLIRK